MVGLGSEKTRGEPFVFLGLPSRAGPHHPKTTVMPEIQSRLPLAASVEFLGNKQRLLPFLIQGMGGTFRAGDKVVDLFCGTGAVSAALKSIGAQVDALDHLLWCTIYTRSLLQNSSSPRFLQLSKALGLNSQKPAYGQILTLLNQLEPIRGFIYRSYSPASVGFSGVRRLYFTEENAARIDAIRGAIFAWRPLLEPREEALLISDLIRSSARVSNVAGTYGCYLKEWKPRALAPLILRPATFSAGSNRHSVYHGDAEEFSTRIDAQVVYADPPYTKRQYAAYYHVLETIAAGDTPTLIGSTGLRPWRDRASDWCYRRKAPDALRRLLSNLGRVRHFFLSYNEDGQIEHEEILAILRPYGEVNVMELATRRYKSSDRPHRGPTVIERLYHLSFNGIGAS
jgi:adenine-specific DNA-methyltransferase